MASFSGILLLDKPLGMTSNGALQRVKYLLRVKKAGHTGSLDPLATGMLPLCLGGEATKFSSYLLDADKKYEVCLQLGACTTTGDAEGEVTLRRPVLDYSLADINQVLAEFLGEIEQIPPMFSAIKQQGRPLYELARQGITVERAKRPVVIYSLVLLDHQNDKLTLAVHCSKGTYIRTLAEDIGHRLGCGAYVCALRRTAVGSYQTVAMTPLANLEEKVAAQNESGIQQSILPVHSCLLHLPRVTVNDNLLFYLNRGQPVRISGVPLQGLVRLMTVNEQLLGVGEVLEDGRVGPKRLIQLQ